MAEKPQRRFWGHARRLFRWLRIAVWLALLTLLLLALWLHRYGLPEFARERLVAELRLRGVELRFTRMRLIWYRGIVADDIHLGRPAETNSPQVSATEAEVHLRVRPLLHRQFDLEGVALRGGRVLIPIWGTNDTPRELVIEKLSGELKFLPGDQWDLRGFNAEAFGVKLRLSGSVTNATAMRSWKFGRTKPEEKSTAAFWYDLVRQFEETKFTAPSDIMGTISGDARRLETFRATVNLSSPAIDAPWGKSGKLDLTAQIRPQPGALIYAEVKLQARDADTRWGRADSVELDSKLAPSLTQWTPTNAHLDLKVKRAQTPWGSAATLALTADFRPNLSDAASALAEYSLRGQQLKTKWARFAQAEFSASGVVSASNAWPSVAKTRLKFAGGEIDAGRAAAGSIEASFTLPKEEAMEIANTNLSWWSRAEKISGEVAAQLTDVHTPQLDTTNVMFAAAWQPPLLTVRELTAALFDGELRATAKLDTTTRRLAVGVKSDFDFQKLSPLLATNGQQWLAECTWDSPPKLSAAAQLTLPPWTNSPVWQGVDWPKEVLPTMALAGNFEVGGATFHGLLVKATQTEFSYSNRTWRLPSLLITRPDGAARIALTVREESHLLEAVIDSALDPRFIRPLFDPDVQIIIDDFTLTSPPLIHAEIAAPWDAPEKLSAFATFAVTNGGYRGRAVLSCRTLITFTNLVLGLMSPEVVRTEGTGRADSVVIDLRRLKLFINNGTGQLEVAAVTHVVGAGVEATMSPYRFAAPPRARVNGFIDLKDSVRSDLRFEVEGGPFEWRAFRFQHITGDVHWAGTTLTMSNVTGLMHGGSLDLSAAFDFAVPAGANFSFRTEARDLNFHSLMRDLSSPTNRLEGTLGGLLVVTAANTDAARSWSGYGHATLQEGLIWDVPALGFFSPILNTLKPGSGNSRARQVAATFVITNSVIFTDDLLIHASGMRLNYDGTVDFDTRINGRMEAEVLRDMPGFGVVVSKVLWPVTKLFEYKVTGTLGKPDSKPLFIPKIFLMPLHPLRTLKELIESDKEDAGK